MSDNFLLEYQDTGEVSIIEEIKKLHFRINELLGASLSVKELRRELELTKGIFERLCESDNIESTLRDEIDILEKRVGKSKAKKNRYLQQKKAKQERVRLANQKRASSKFSKTQVFRDNIHFIENMRKEATLQEVCDYFNKKHKREIEENCLAPFHRIELSMFLKKLKDKEQIDL